MAQSKSFFGLRKGSTKSLTFQVLNGKQITKDRVFNVKNPQTISQMNQRALMATTIRAYSSLKTICDHSFEDFEVGAKTMSEFIKLNLNRLKLFVPNINVTEYKSQVYVNNNYIVSRGTIKPLECTLQQVNSERFNYYSTGKVAGETMTYEELANACGLKQDGMITIMLVANGDLYWVRIKFTEAIMSTQISFDTNLINQIQEVDPEAVEGNAVELADDISLIKDSKDKSIVKIKVKLNQNECAACILSQKYEGKWRRSNAELAGDYTKNYEAGFSTYPVNTSLLLNGGKMSSNVL